MLCLGFSGGLNRVHENPYALPATFTHDGAAALVEDGEVVTAIEEERLNRIKHSNKFPEEAIRYCLERHGAGAADVDQFAFYATEEYCNARLAYLHRTQPSMPTFIDARTRLAVLLSEALDADVDLGRIHFFRHHMAHAASASAVSGFERSLVLAIDGYGDDLSGLVACGEGSALTELTSFPQRKSLGMLYLNVIEFLGYGRFDEYKVMALAPYGDPEVYRSLLAGLYELRPGGDYELDFNQIAGHLTGQVDVRKPGQPLEQRHYDLAAALQEALEKIVLHILVHHREATGLSELCIAGGVALNCTMNGAIASSGCFDGVFVQPAAHDAGCALGAALLGSHQEGRPARGGRLRNVYWGTDVGEQDEVAAVLDRWRGLVSFERYDNIEAETATRLADGQVVGWAQGRSEFGPRALGNRSILADPRREANRERINAMVKKRESYRPFAPSVLEEAAHELFDLPAGTDEYEFMLYVVDVREEMRTVLPAITHVDGTARVQVVPQSENPRFWKLIYSFGEITGVPALLNTSFNNNVEPIVDSVEDAVVSFLTTTLDLLVVGDFAVSRRAPEDDARLSLRASLPPHVLVAKSRRHVSRDRATVSAELMATYGSGSGEPISLELADWLIGLDGDRPLADLLAGAPPSSRQGELLDEVDRLWTLRLLRLRPGDERG
jgi:carbamoyltransferase